jgi:tRNA A58 N-methylase Trm61
MSQRYAEQWAITSAMHERNGDYAWAAEMLLKHAGSTLNRGSPILDIGTGNGIGVTEILRVVPSAQFLCIENDHDQAEKAHNFFLEKISNTGVYNNTNDLLTQKHLRSGVHQKNA